MADVADMSNVVPDEGTCCFEPTEFDQFKIKLFEWYNNQVSTKKLQTAINKKRIGKKLDYIEDVYVLSKVANLLHFIITIKYQMLCSGDTWETFISKEEINKI